MNWTGFGRHLWPRFDMKYDKGSEGQARSKGSEKLVHVCQIVAEVMHQHVLKKNVDMGFGLTYVLSVYESHLTFTRSRANFDKIVCSFQNSICFHLKLSGSHPENSLLIGASTHITLQIKPM